MWDDPHVDEPQLRNFSFFPELFQARIIIYLNKLSRVKSIF